MKEIYLDHAATSPLDQKVIEDMHTVFTRVYGNPSSIHSFGRKARQYVDKARRTIARSIHAEEKEIIFTSGGTESNNLALIGTAFANRLKGNHIITTKQEHHSVLHAAKYLETKGFDVTYLPVNKDGLISVDDLQQALTDETILVSIMAVNNETGIIQPINEVGTILIEHQAYFHCDGVQALGLLDIDVKEMGIDLFTASAHKIYGPKGIGFLYASDDVLIQARQFGGEQERKKRPGTENVASIVGFETAVLLASENRKVNWETYESYKKLFIDTLLGEEVIFSINGDPTKQIASTVNMSFPGMNVESLLTNFDLEGIAASSGSACTAGSVESSHVLVAMFGEEDERTLNSIRFSFGNANNEENVKEAAKRIARIFNRLKK